jgi:hypothetical protein
MYTQSVGTLYCRALLHDAIIRSAEQKYSLEMLKTQLLFSPAKTYRLLRTLFADQYHIQQPNFVTNLPEYSVAHQRLWRALQSLYICDWVAEEALTELQLYSELLPHYRCFQYKQDFNENKIAVRIWNASSLCITFANKSELPSASDILTLHYDQNGNKKSRQFKGPLILPRRVIMTGDRFWFEFKTTSIKESTGFQFYVCPSTFSLNDSVAINSFPNLAVATTTIAMVQPLYWLQNPPALDRAFQAGIKHLLTPFAPFKGMMCDALKSMVSQSMLLYNEALRPSLALLKKFRAEVEFGYDEFIRHHEKEASSLPIFHSITDLLSMLRQAVQADLCSSLICTGISERKKHMYAYQESLYGRHIKACTSCAMTVQSHSVPKYHAQDSIACQATVAKQFKWKEAKVLSSSSPFLFKEDCSHLVPMERLSMNPADWFEHVPWVDQIAIVRQLLSCFAEQKNSGRVLPPWVLFEATLETRKKVVYRESTHPYHVLKDNGQIHIPGAKTLFISFDKHSKTHKCDRLLFSATTKAGDELGSYGGDELKDKTIVVHGNKLYYTFKAVGGDHECNCNHCGSRVLGVRYHCTECDDFDLCAKCIMKPRVHPDTHLFLKIRRPVDCVPAALPHLYTTRWTSSAPFRGSVHLNVKCNGCSVSPIRGIRYWCENCEDYNLCEKCAEEEYKYHDRMHVFLRVVRPLPPKNQLPPNALPYGLVYEKDLDTHWGYLFSVSTSDSQAKYSDPDIIKTMLDIQECMKEWNPEMDRQLVDYVENCSNGWQSLEPSGLTPTGAQLVHYPLLTKPSLKSMRYRFVLLKILNRKLSRVLHLLDSTENSHTVNCQQGDSINAIYSMAKNMLPKSPPSLASLLSSLRSIVFKSVKIDVWSHIISKTVHEVQPISLKLNRHKASEETTSKIQAEKNSMFCQAFRQLRAVHPKVLSRKNGAWKVTFVGESADDYGGPFRDSLTQLCAELQSSQIPLFIPVPNQVNAVGENRDKFIANPMCNTRRYLKWFRFMGMVLGIGLLTKNVLALDLPSFVWKYMVQEPITMKDLEGIDQFCIQHLKQLNTSILQNAQEQNLLLDLVDNQDESAQVLVDSFVTTTSNQTTTSQPITVELIPNGSHIPVTFSNATQYVTLLEQYKLHREFKSQLDAIRDGLYSIISPRYISLLSWQELELMICGSPNIDLNILKKHTIYEGYTAASREIKDFWAVLESFDSNERSLYLRFTWGRSRLPTSEDGFTHPMKIQRLERQFPDKVLPLSHTCFFSIELPSYSSRKVMREKLLYAITHCKAIDTDFTTTATEARNLGVQ